MPVPDNFYEHIGHLDEAVEQRLLQNLMPKFADFVNRVLLRGVTFRSQLHYIDDKSCVLPHEKQTYTHFLLDCPVTQAVWHVFVSVMSSIGFYNPPSLENCLFGSPRLTRPWMQVTFTPAQNDNIFRPYTPETTPESIARKAVFAVKIHLQHLVLQDPDDRSLVRLVLLLIRNP
ncbi:hypothetical protein ACHHYP_05362 [Achlya hypogyna]|uniref:Reverse transcriptase zinc-binding domain-containing protein n=1 Tax=Achlya hypogyna TaxID=1202772 RepID=A0A1V9YY42_ACHHY|nr:hypothetical protein ACHHYP_05362 [Achlya hypogyna]